MENQNVTIAEEKSLNKKTSLFDILENGFSEETVEEFLLRIKKGEISILDMFRTDAPEICSKKDYKKWVCFWRIFSALLWRRDFADVFKAEAEIEFSKHLKDGWRNASIETVKKKDGIRLFKKLVSMHPPDAVNGLKLLHGDSFEDKFSQYKKITSYIENLWMNACKTYRDKNYPLCIFLSILTLEEIGKIHGIFWELLPGELRQVSNEHSNKKVYSHATKHFTAVISGALINSRLDRILGFENIKKLLQDAESGELEKIRQSCLYLKPTQMETIMPSEVFSQNDAKFYVVLAGEILTERLGHFPWEFDRLRSLVSDFELEIGFSPTQIEPELT